MMHEKVRMVRVFVFLARRRQRSMSNLSKNTNYRFILLKTIHIIDLPVLVEGIEPSRRGHSSANWPRRRAPIHVKIWCKIESVQRSFERPVANRHKVVPIGHIGPSKSVEYFPIQSGRPIDRLAETCSHLCSIKAQSPSTKYSNLVPKWETV